MQFHEKKFWFTWFHEFFCLYFFKFSGPLCTVEMTQVSFLFQSDFTSTYLSITSNISCNTSWTTIKCSYCNWGLTSCGINKGKTLVASRLTERPYRLSETILRNISGKEKKNIVQGKILKTKVKSSGKYFILKTRKCCIG